MSERAVRWFRVSSDGQDEENQVKDVGKHCDRNGYQVVEKTFRLHDVSASKGEQEPALQEVLADIRAGLYTVVVVAHSSRLDRRDPDLQQFYALSVRMAGGRIESAREPEFGKASLSGRVLTLLAQEENHKYSRDLSGHVKAARERVTGNGALWGRVPWGYEIRGDKYSRRLEPTQAGLTWVPQIFARIIAGESSAAVARWLESQGVMPAGIRKARADGKGKSGRWWPRTVGDMIKNPTYMGYRLSEDGKSIAHRCTPLVDAAVFKAAGLALAPDHRRGAAKADNRAMLAGGAFCGREVHTAGPDSPMNRIRTRQGVFYRCTGRGADRKGCGCMVRAETADAGMEMLVMTWFTQPVMRTRIERGHDHKAELAAIEFEMRQLSAQGLDWEAEDAERARLRAEYRRVAGLPGVPDRVITEKTGEIYADLWDAVPVNERGRWLADNGLTVCLSKEAVWLRENSPAALSCAKVNYSAEAGGFSADRVSEGARPLWRFDSEAA